MPTTPVPFILRYKHFIFDLDGTLVETAPDIFDIIRQTLTEAGLPVPQLDTTLIGPLLEDIFKKLCPEQSEETISQLADTYRAHYFVSNYPKSIPYPGIPQLFECISRHGGNIYLATNKSRHGTIRLMTKTGLLPAITDIATSDTVPGMTLSKADMIRLLMQRHGITANQAVMTGDSQGDIHGGKAAGIATAAALYGYGKKEELIATQPDYLITDKAWTGIITYPEQQIIPLEG